MANDTARSTAEAGLVILDPTLNVWQRRYFHQPVDGPYRRAFTARRAVLGWPDRVARPAARWAAARDRATAARGRSRWF